MLGLSLNSVKQGACVPKISREVRGFNEARYVSKDASIISRLSGTMLLRS